MDRREVTTTCIHPMPGESTPLSNGGRVVITVWACLQFWCFLSSLGKGLIYISSALMITEKIFAPCRRSSSVLHQMNTKRSGTSLTVHCLSTLFRRSSESKIWPSGKSTSGALGPHSWWAGDCPLRYIHSRLASCLPNVSWVSGTI